MVEKTILGPLRYRSGIKKDTRRAPVPGAPYLVINRPGRETLLELHPRVDGNDYELYMPTQVGFPSFETGETRYFRLDDLDRAISDETIDTRSQHYIVGAGPNSRQEAVCVLANKGIVSKDHREDPAIVPQCGEDGRLEVEARTLIDPLIKRAMAKIAFNYLAWAVIRDLNGSWEWLMQHDFDAVRDFIRRGDVGDSPRFRIGKGGFLVQRGTGKTASGHVITLSWQRYRRDMVARVSLFLQFEWETLLARSFDRISWDLRSGHFWNLENRTVKGLTPRPAGLWTPL
ncbi:MAG: hypothetical protein GTN65_09700 [Armatimonadetes bacterium]|nr:hypothetical protein [Armatimonadota bacterium]NIO97354.1 hypothetical protein [Armatimonadota bacterium]